MQKICRLGVLHMKTLLEYTFLILRDLLLKYNFSMEITEKPSKV